MKYSLRSRRRRTVVGGVVLTLVLGGLAAALPAGASTVPSATSTPHGGTAASTIVRPATLIGGSPAEGAASPAAVEEPVITDSLNTGGVTAPDAILTCATSQITIGGTQAVAVPVGCLTLYNGEWVEVTWTGGGVTAELNQQTDGNLVLSAGNGVTTWAADTTFSGNSAGPGCLAQFQSSANLVVSNCDSTSIWNSDTHPSYANAVLAFQADGNIVIYESSAGTPLWSSGVPLTANSTLVNGDGGKCLAPEDSGSWTPSVNEDPVWLYSCTGLSDEQWRYVNDGTLVNGNGGKCLAPEDSGSWTPSVNEDPIWLYSCTGLSDESWS